MQVEVEEKLCQRNPWESIRLKTFVYLLGKKWWRASRTLLVLVWLRKWKAICSLLIKSRRSQSEARKNRFMATVENFKNFKKRREERERCHEDVREITAISMWVNLLSLWKQVKVNHHTKGDTVWRMYKSKLLFRRWRINMIQERAIVFSFKIE